MTRSKWLDYEDPFERNIRNKALNFQKNAQIGEILLIIFGFIAFCFIIYYFD